MVDILYGLKTICNYEYTKWASNILNCWNTISNFDSRSTTIIFAIIFFAVVDPVK